MKKYFLYSFNLLVLLSFYIRPQELASQSLIQISPKNNFTFHSDSVYFSWNLVNDAFYYELSVSEDPLFIANNFVYHVSNLRSDTTIENLTFCKQYYWKIKTLTLSGTYYSAVKTFNVFTPRCIPGLELWLSADSGVVADGLGNVSDWIDRSGKGNSAIQTVATNQPLLFKDVSNTSNKCSFIKTDGIDDYMNINHSFGIASLFLAFNWGTASANFPGYNTILSTQTYTSKGIVFMGVPGTPNYYDDGVSNTFSPGEVEFNGITTLNMSPLSDFKLCSAVKSSSTTLSNFYFSRYLNDPTSFWNGSIGDMIIYNTSLSSIEKNKVESYVHDKYAPPVDLGPDQTVCSLPLVFKVKKDYFKTYIWQDGSTADSMVVNTPGTYYVTTTNCFGITSSDTVIINTDSFNYSVDLGPNDTTLCNGTTLFLYAGPKHLSYSWSNGSTHNSLTVTSPGKYYVTMTNCLNNITTDTINVFYKQSPIFSLGNDTTVCYNLNSLVLESIYSDSTTYLFAWSSGASTASITPNHSGQYWLNVTNNYFCSYADTINIIIDSTLSLVSLGPDDSLCSGNLITLTQGMSPSLTYTWSTSSNNDSLLITNTGQYSVIVTNTNNCVAKDTIDITILGFAPTANFSSNIGCVNQIVSFTDLSIPPSGNTISNYEWDFGDVASPTNTSTVSNPLHTYTNTGTYTVSLKVISNAGCEQTIRKIIQVFPKPTVNFISGISCQNDSTAFSSLTTSTSGYTISSLNWNFGDPASGLFNTSSLTSPKHLFSNQSNYTIKLVAINNVGCKDSLINIIAVRAQVKADFTISSPCANNATVFQDNSIVPPSPNTNIRTWNLGSGPVNGLSVSKTYTSSGVYYVTLTVNSSNQCSSSITKLITIYASPTASFAIPAFCSKDTITATNLSVAQSGIITSTNWKLNSVNFSSIQNPTLSISNAGSYNVRLTVTNSFGCKDSITKAILVNPLPNADFTTNPTTYYYINSPVNFIPSITNASSYFWSLSSIGTSTAQSPSATYNTEGTYTVSLNLQDLQGCKNSVTKTLFVSKRFLDVAILNVNSTKDNDGFMTIQTDIANYGSIPVSTLDLSYKVSDGGNVQETWNGTLNPNSFFSYTFVSKTATQIGSSNNITCVDVKKANGINDQNQTNNELCNVLNTNDITVSNPIPNPTNADITLPIILNKEIDFSVSIYNSNGQIQYEEKTQKGIIGLNLITLPTANYARGCYIIKTVIDDKIFIKKFIKISNE